MRTFICTLLLLLLSACSNEQASDYIDAPNLDFECSFLDAQGCHTSNINKPIFIGLEDNLNANCRTKIALLKDTQFISNFIYSAWTLTITNGSILTGVFTHWVNYAQTPIINMPKQSYKVCSFIDLNENGQVDILEPMSESLLTLGENDFLPISNWSNY